VENARVAALLGPLLVLAFCLSQALRDVYFGHVFQGMHFFAVILLAFTLSTLVFGSITAVRTPAEFKTLRGHIATVLAMNLTTAIAWSCYFFALTHLQPSIVNTVHSGMGPLTVVALAACGVRLAKPGVVGRGELWSYAAIAVSIVALWWVVLSGRSGLRAGNEATDLIGLVLLMISGSSITISLLYSKRLHDHGVSAQAVTAVRYLLLILVAAGAQTFNGRIEGVSGLVDLATLSIAAPGLIVLPLFILQVGIALTAPLTAHVIRSLGPVCVFVLEQVDGRLVYSRPTLICIVFYSAAVIASNLAHGWKERAVAA
jgi:drug/metabolite transporter (DMT)-like permease